MRALVDTSAIIALFKNDQKTISVVEKADKLFTSTLCAYELLLGEAYSRLKGSKVKERVMDFLDNVDVIDFTLSDARKASEIKAVMRSKGKEVNTIDILISSTAHRLELPVITKDRDFKVISRYVELETILIL